MRDVLSTDVVKQQRTRRVKAGHPPADRRFEWAVILLSLFAGAGAYLDGWAHNNGKTDQSFFTPWHAVLYSGMALVALVLWLGWVRGVAKGYGWRRALPQGYGLSLVGVGVFMVGGIADMLWHTFLGIEASFEALYSPSHLLLGLGMALIAAGPLSAFWQRRADPRRLVDQLPILLALTVFWSTLTFFSQDMHWMVGLPGLRSRPTGGAFYYIQSAGFASILLQTAIVMGILLFALRRWRLAPGAITLMFALNGLLMVFEDRVYRWDLLAAAVVGGVAGDILLAWLKPGYDRPWAVRIFAAGLPAVFFLLHFLVMRQTEGLWWSVHLWTGAMALAAAVGWLLSLAFLPPALPAGE